MPDLLEQGRQAQRPPAADHVFGPGEGLLLDLRQPRHPISAGGRLGDGERDQGRQPDRRGLDRRRRDRRGRFPQCGDLRRRLPRAGDPQRRQQPVGDLELLRHRRRRAHHLRRARGRLRHCRPQGRRQRRARRLCRDPLGGGPGALQPRADPDRAVHLPGRGPFDLGRSDRLPAAGMPARPGRSAIRSRG